MFFGALCRCIVSVLDYNESMMMVLLFINGYIIPYGTNLKFDGVILTNGPRMKFDEQNFYKFIIAFIGRVLQRIRKE